MQDFLTQIPLGATGMMTSRMGLSASYRPGIRSVHRAIDVGMSCHDRKFIGKLSLPLRMSNSSSKILPP